MRRSQVLVGRVRRSQVLVGAAAAVLPFAVLALFTWARDGRAAPLPALLGRGDLLPPTALFAAQALTELLGPRPGRRPVVRIATGWTLFAGACALFPLPYAGGTGFETRVAHTSLVVFGGAVALNLTSTSRRRSHDDCR